MPKMRGSTEVFHSGDVIVLTQAYERFVFERNPNLRISLVNRFAKIENILDWDNDNGRKIEEARIKTGKWKKYPLEVMRDNRYVVSIYYPELKNDSGKPVVETAVIFSKDPNTGQSFFEKVPEGIYRALMAKCQTFTIIEEGAK